MKNGTPVILCVGSDNIAGDCVGPYVGDLLKSKFKIRCFVYGQSGEAVNGKNIPMYLDMIKKAHPDSPVIAVDACVSQEKEEGTIEVRRGVFPGRAVKGGVNRTGDIGILAVVARPSVTPLNALLTVSWDKIEKMCYKVAFAIYKATAL